MVALLTVIGSWYWAVPYQNGFLYVAADYFVQSVIVLACLTAMSAIVHPVLAVLTVIVFNESTIKLAIGDRLDLETLIDALASCGYQRVPQTEEPGDFSVRGGIVDAYSPLYNEPIRIGIGKGLQ